MSLGDDKPKVTVIVCAYQSGERIKPTLDSILKQSFRDFELLVIDDASGDETVNVIRAIQDERIRLVVNEKNLGVVASRNKGVSLARGEYIAHCDHDDLWASEKLAKQVVFLDVHPECGLVSTSIDKYRQGKICSEGEKIERSSHYLRWSLLLDSTFAHSAIMYRTSIFRDNGLCYLPEFTFADDWDFFLQIAKVTKIASIPESLTHYLLHDENWSIRAGQRMSNNGKNMIAREINSWIDRGVEKEDTDDYFDAVVTGIPCESRQQLLAVGKLMRELNDAFVLKIKPNQDDCNTIQHLTSCHWWRVVRNCAAVSGPATLKCYWNTETPNWKKINIIALSKDIAASGAKNFIRVLGGNG